MATPKTKPTNETDLNSGVGTSDARSGEAKNKNNPDVDAKQRFPDSTGESSKSGRSDVNNEETE